MIRRADAEAVQSKVPVTDGATSKGGSKGRGYAKQCVAEGGRTATIQMVGELFKTRKHKGGRLATIKWVAKRRATRGGQMATIQLQGWTHRLYKTTGCSGEPHGDNPEGEKLRKPLTEIGDSDLEESSNTSDYHRRNTWAKA